MVRSPEDPSTITVSWRPFTLVEARGFIEYIILLHQVSSVKRQAPLMQQAGMEQSSVVFSGVDTSIDYQATVGTGSLTAGGVTGPGQCSVAIYS